MCSYWRYHYFPFRTNPAQWRLIVSMKPMAALVSWLQPSHTAFARPALPPVPAGTATSALLWHPPSPSSPLAQGSGGHTTLCWPSLEPKKLFPAQKVPPSWRWFWLLQCLLSPYKVFNSFSTFPSSEREHISTSKDKKARGGDHIGYVPSAALYPTACLTFVHGIHVLNRKLLLGSCSAIDHVCPASSLFLLLGPLLQGFDEELVLVRANHASLQHRAEIEHFALLHIQQPLGVNSHNMLKHTLVLSREQLGCREETRWILY